MQPGAKSTEGYEVSERSIGVVPHDEDADARQESRHVGSAEQILSKCQCEECEEDPPATASGTDLMRPLLE